MCQLSHIPFIINFISLLCLIILVWLINVGRPTPTDSYSVADYEFRLYTYSIIIHRAGFEPAPPKRMGLKSIALDHSANDAVCFSVFFFFQ